MSKKQGVAEEPLRTDPRLLRQLTEGFGRD